MEESEDNLSAEDIRFEDELVKAKPKKRSLVERELETNLTARVTSPILNRDATSTSRYGRARRLKTEADFCDTDKAVSKCLKSPKHDVTKSPIKVQSPAYKMHASNSPIRVETPKRPESSLGNQIESIYNENISLSRFGSEEKKSVAKKFPKVYIRKDLIQTKEREIDDTVVLIKNIFSPNKSITKSNSSFNFESSAEKNYSNKSNGYMNSLSVVKTLDFDGNNKKKKKRDEKKSTLSKSELFELEAKSEYQVGDLAWARMGTYPFWPCIITRDPLSGMFVKKKLFGRIERDVMHVTFFGDNGRRGWIVDSMLRKFLGQLEFETTRMNFTIEAKKKDHRLYAAFFISEKKTPQWQISVEEAESLLREPKRLRIDILNDMIEKSRNFKTTPKIERGRKVTRTNSDVSLSESLYDTLFSEDDSKVKEAERSRSKSRNRSLDVSEVVTACLDNMAAKTGITKIQRQSHMDRWLQKAKSKTPEKSHYKPQAKESSSKSKKKSKETRSSKRSESFNKSHNDHDYSQKYSPRNSPIIIDEVEIEYNNAEIFNIEPGSGIGIISKVETLCKNQNNKISDNVILDNGPIEQNNAAECSLKSNLTDNQTNEAELVFNEPIKDLNSMKITNEINKNTSSIYSKIPDIIDNNILDNIFATDDSSSDMDTNNESIDIESSKNQINSEVNNINNLPPISVNEENDENIGTVNNCNQEINNDVQEMHESTEKSAINDNQEMDFIQLEINTNSVESDALYLDSNRSNTANCNALNEEVHDTKLSDSSDDVDNKNMVIENDKTLELESKISDILESIVEKVKDFSAIDDKMVHKTRHNLALKKSVEKTKDNDIKSNLLRNSNLNINESVTYNQLENGHIDNILDEFVDLEKIPLSNIIINSEDTTHHDKDDVITTESLPSNVNIQDESTENKKNKGIEDVCFGDLKNLKNTADDQINTLIQITPKEIESITLISKSGDLLSCGSNKIEIKVTNTNKEDDCMAVDTLSDLNELNHDVVNFDDERYKEINKDVLKAGNDSNEEMSVQNDVKSDEEVVKQMNIQEVLTFVDQNNEIHKELNFPIEKDPKDDDNVSIKSEGSEVSLSKRKRAKDKSILHKKDVLEDPEFLKYLELRQDAVMDDHPELSQEDITNYLYKTWIYEENLKPDIKKTDDMDQSNLVKGLNLDPAPVKKVRKKVKIEKEIAEPTVKEKSKRKIIQPFYKEDFSDGDDSIEYFEIFKTKKELKGGLVSDIKPDTLQSEGTVLERIINVDEYTPDEYDDVEEYFRQLTAPKPNVFKGYTRERVCEVCEKVGNLVKCKGCHSMFHIECDRKEIEVIECPTPSRGRRKKKKTRGRKPKDDPGQDSGSDEKSQDANVSEELLNMSVEEESHITANADEFEALLSANMQEILKDQSIKYDFYTREELDWNDTHIGECKIVNIKPRMDSIELTDYSEFKCKNCQKFDPPICFVCKYPISPKEKQADRQKCQVVHCNKYYHLECLDHWPQTQFTHSSQVSRSNKFCEALSCPRHVCHTCVCDDPRGCKTRFSGDKLARCVRCPATYHTFSKCLPAGTQILTASFIICPRHYEHRPGKVPCHVNTGWCFICALGGSLICCEYCPTSFHAECLNIKPPEGGYMCEDCETGRLPLYGEMVWVKLGHYRWWPGIILHPSEIPDNILAVKHTLGEFVVRFFGQYDYYWVNRGRVFPFQEGDSGKVSSQRSKIDAAFTMAMEHAQRACEILKKATPNEEESSDIASSLLPPHYVKLKVNKPCGSLCGKKIDLEESSLTQCECDPNDVVPCGPYSQCLNRMLLTECGPTCRAADRCNNRAFEKRLYPRLEPYRTPHRGWGLRAAEDIRAGRFVIEYVGELLDEDEFRRRMSRKHEVRDENFYFLTLDKERMIDAGPKGNLARFMNHSCEPNCETQKWTVLGDVRVGLFAICDIPANTELTFNYNLETSGIEKKRCMCGAKRCSGYIGAKPKQEDQPKKLKPHVKRTYKKRTYNKAEDSPTTSHYKKRGRPLKPRELTDIEKDLLIIKNATNGLSSDSECSRLSMDSWKESKALKRKRIDLSTDEMSPKRAKSDELNMVY